MTIRDIAIAFGFKVDKESEKKVENSVKQLKSMATKALGAIGVGFSLFKLNSLIEEYKAINQEVKAATGELVNQKEVQNAILQSAQNSRQSYAATATAVSDLLNTHSKLFKSVQDTADFVELTGKAFKAAGANESQVASLNSALANAFTTGKVSAGTFQTLMKECPQSIVYLSKTLGISEQHVKSLGTAGAITANQLYTAFTANADAINSAFQGVDLTITGVLKHIRDGFGLWLTQLNDTLQITQTISKIALRVWNSVNDVLKKVTNFTERLVKRMGGVTNVLKLIGIVGGSILGVMHYKEIIGFLKTVLSLINLTTLKIAAVIAVVTLIALLIEDFVQFMKGNDSIFGLIFEKMGILTV